ncbi:histidine phosphatase family protein [Lunatibacter salilacus]|uniref:histidine phosphatase family protein n=1 Tax=Lunatibacter salilacus TaxID=2483804 RepID=UPI00131B7E88|nr:histidine phosphatase family protein [Lunatibacter salilacus]
MSSKKIYVVRHGQTDYNLKGVVQGSGIDAPINDTGRKQANLFYEKNKHLPIDQIYFSGLIRTRQSIEKFLESDVPFTRLPELNEISWGIYEGTPMDEKENQYYIHMLSKWNEGFLDYKIDRGESPQDVAKRLTRAIDIIRSAEGKHILVCMHGRAIRILMCLMLGYELRFMDAFKHQNLCCYELNQLDDGQIRLESYTPSPVG